MELGRSWRTLLLMMLLLRPRGAGQPRGHRQQAALKEQRFRGGVNLIGTHFPRARARAEPSDAFRQQTDPLEPAGRRFANLRQ